MSTPLGSLVEEMRAEAAILRRWGADAQAAAVEVAAVRIEEALREWELEGLTLDLASEESGFSEAHLGRLVRDGQIKNVGEGRRVKVRRRDLPRKVKRGTSGARQGEPDLAAQVLRARGLDVP